MTSATGDPIRVGLIGASPRRGWASVAHLPALDALPGFSAVAVSSSRLDGAREVAQRWGIAKAFDDSAQLVQDPDVDAVVVCVKTPEHAPLVRAAIAAGKHVYCEWPLGVSYDEARELTDLAERAGVQHIVGMQAYESPGARFVADILRRGVVGEVVSASLVSLSPHVGGRVVSADLAYTADRSSGTNVLTTSTGHALAAMSRLVGDMACVSASVKCVYPEVVVAGTSDVLANDAPNEVAVVGRSVHDVPVTIAVHGGTPLGIARFTLHLVCTEGAVVVRPTTNEDSINVGDWTVTIAPADDPARELPVVDDSVIPMPPGPAKNIARMYAAWASAIRTGEPAEMNFRRATQFHFVLDAIERSASTGREVQAQGPTLRNAFE